MKRKHNVTLFAASTSNTSAHLIAKWPPLYDNLPGTPSKDAAYDWLMSEVRRMAHQFDIVHFHTDIHWTQSYQIYKDNNTVVLMTTHWVSSPMAEEQFKDFPLVSVLDNQQKTIGLQANFIGTVNNGIPKNLYTFVQKPNSTNYLAFLGRIDPSKNPIWAIQIAIKAGMRLKIAAKVTGDAYWKNTVKPLIKKNRDLVEYIGEVNDTIKNTFLGNAVALLFPIDWEEPLATVIIEAMACGTPVVARRRGSVPEMIEEGISGFIFDTIDEGVQAVQKASQLDRSAVRRAFERRFTVEKMVDGYEAFYKQMLRKKMESQIGI